MNADQDEKWTEPKPEKLTFKGQVEEEDPAKESERN